MVEIYAVELKGMSLMATDTMEAMEAAKVGAELCASSRELQKEMTQG